MGKLDPVLMKLGKWAKANDVQILIGGGIMMSTTSLASAVWATVKSKDAIDPNEKMCRMDKLKRIWKYWILPVGSKVASDILLIYAGKADKAKVAGLTSLLTASEAAAAKTAEKIKELYGEKAEDKVKQSLAQDEINKNPGPSSDRIGEGSGTEIFYDMVIGRYFMSSRDKVDNAARRIRETCSMRRYRSEGVEVNVFYQLLNCKSCDFGSDNYLCNYDIFGEDRPFEVSYQTCFYSDGETPCTAIRYDYIPMRLRKNIGI